MRVHHNTIRNVGRMTSFAGLMLDNMGTGDGDLGNFVGAEIFANATNCNFGQGESYYGCDIGINVGPYAAPGGRHGTSDYNADPGTVVN